MSAAILGLAQASEHRGVKARQREHPVVEVDERKPAAGIVVTSRTTFASAGVQLEAGAHWRLNEE